MQLFLHLSNWRRRIVIVILNLITIIATRSRRQPLTLIPTPIHLNPHLLYTLTRMDLVCHLLVHQQNVQIMIILTLMAIATTMGMMTIRIHMATSPLHTHTTMIMNITMIRPILIRMTMRMEVTRTRILLLLLSVPLSTAVRYHRVVCQNDLR